MATKLQLRKRSGPVRENIASDRLKLDINGENPCCVKFKPNVIQELWFKATFLASEVSHAHLYLFLCTYSCRECLLVTLSTSPLSELPKMPLPCWISSCSLPHPESLRCAVSVLPSLMAPDRLELMEYLRTVMTVFSVKQYQYELGWIHFHSAEINTERTDWGHFLMSNLNVILSFYSN